MAQSFTDFFLKANIKLKLILFFLVLMALTIIFSTGWLTYGLLKLAHPKSKNHLTIEKPIFESLEIRPFTYKYEIEKMSITLFSRSGAKMYYVQFDILFDCPSEDAKKQMELRRAQIRDAIFQSSADFRIEDFKNAQNFNKFKKTIIANIEKFLGKNAPKNIVFNNWLVN